MNMSNIPENCMKLIKKGFPKLEKVCMMQNKIELITNDRDTFNNLVLRITTTIGSGSILSSGKRHYFYIYIPKRTIGLIFKKELGDTHDTAK